MTATTPARPRPSLTAAHLGHLLAAVATTALLWAVNISPGWRILPFLTGDTVHVLGLVNASLYAGLVVHLIDATYDSPWLRAAGDMLANGVGLAAVIRVGQIFPFDFTGFAFDATLLTRSILVVGGVGAAIGVIVNCVKFLHAILHPGAGPAPRAPRTR